MKSSLLLVGAALSCAVTYAGNAPAASNLHDVMKNVVAVQAQVIWDVGNQAQDDKGDPDPSKLKPADWGRIIAASKQVSAAARSLAQNEHLVVAPAGQKIEGEGPSSFGAKQVQAVIDANPQTFRAFAQALSISMDQILAAAQTKDATKLLDSSGTLDKVCEDCHLQFWYPDQKRRQ
jgi:cytochrome c556